MYGRMSHKFVLPTRLRHAFSCPDDRLRESLHLFQLRATLQQQQIDARIFKLSHTLCDTIRRADESGTKTAIRDAVLFERNFLFESRSCQPLLIVFITRRKLFDVRDAFELALRFGLALAHNRIRSDTKLQRRQTESFSAPRHVLDLLAHARRLVAVHDVRVTPARDQILRGFGFAPRINHRPRARGWFRLQHRIVNAVILPRVRKVIFLPKSFDDLQPLARPCITIIVNVVSSWWADEAKKYGV